LLGNRGDNRYRAVPEYARRLEDFRMTDAEWEAFAIRSGLRSLSQHAGQADRCFLSRACWLN